MVKTLNANSVTRPTMQKKIVGIRTKRSSCITSAIREIIRKAIAW